MFALTLTIGIATSLLLLEITGLVAGGVIVPAYVSLILTRPESLAILLAMALVAFLCVRVLGQLLLLYGTRRYSVSLLLGGLLNVVAQSLPPAAVAIAVPIEWSAFGYLVPGLIAYHFDRQGVLKTVLMIAIAAPLVRAVQLLFST